jgi:hypothetical protein
MNQLTLKPRKAVEELPIENWDDEDLDVDRDDFIIFRSASLATTATHHRESVSSSRMSTRSDWGSNQGDDERHVHLPGDDERSTIDAIAMAKRAGIPIPENVPSSALLGGTIKKLGGRKLKKNLQEEDWDDLELPGEGGFKIKQPDASNFPDELRKISGGSVHTSPSKRMQVTPILGLGQTPELKSKSASHNLLLQFKDKSDFPDEIDDDFGDDGTNTLKVAKIRNKPRLLPLVTPPTPEKNGNIESYDDFEDDLQLPAHGEPFKLSTRKDIPGTPAAQATLDIDDWAEGSLGTRFGGTRRDGRSNRSSSASALSPSVASSLTVESEDEGLDGLVLPSGPIHFDDILKRRQQDRSPDHHTPEKQAARRAEVKEDFMTGLEIGDGDVFDSGKLTLNRNVKMKTTRQTSPTRPKAAVSLTFTNKPTPAPISRLPRPLGGHERAPSSLEPVSESGGPIANRNRRSQSRMGGHSAHSSITSIGTPTTPSASTNPFQPSTPRHRAIGSKQSNPILRNEPTTTNAQLLKLKRSMPTMRSYPQSPAKPMTRYERPPSRSETGSRAHVSRPKTPNDRDRSGAESSLSHARRNPLPFLPAGAGAATNKSHHVTITTKTSRHFRRNDSESSSNSLELRPSSRAVSRSTMRSPSPKRNTRGGDLYAGSAASKRIVTKPVNSREIYSGDVLSKFDDLPILPDAEKRFVKEPVGRGPPKLSNLRNRFAEAPSLRSHTPAPLTPHSPARINDGLPRFARDTTASRMAREYSLAQRAPSASGGAPLVNLTNQWKAKVAATTGLTTATALSVRAKKPKGGPQKPQLIKPLGNLNNPKCMFKHSISCYVH